MPSSHVLKATNMHFASRLSVIAAFCFCLVVAKNETQHHRKEEYRLSASGADDAPYFLRAMQEYQTVIIPKCTTLNIETRLDMTGLRDKHINLEGTIKFKPDIPYWTGNGFFIPYQTQITFWLLGGENILLDGGGTLDGSGQLWWDTFATNSTLQRPIILTVFQAENVTIRDITMLNGPEWHNLVNEGQNIKYDNVSIYAVSNSTHRAANTDGWNTYRSNNVRILNSVIVNGDDCASFKPSMFQLAKVRGSLGILIGCPEDSTNVLVENLDCTGSHGISVGSLGQYPGVFDIVENVLAKNIKMTNAQNGARIKAFAGPNVGSGLVKNITFENFVESEVDHPVIIDQCYETNATACAQFPSNTLIQDIRFINITGTSTRSTVASLSCSPGNRCSNISVQELGLSFPSGTTKYSCQNVNVTGDSAYLFPACTIT